MGLDEIDGGAELAQEAEAGMALGGLSDIDGGGGGGGGLRGAGRWKRETEREREPEDAKPVVAGGGGLDGAGRWKRERQRVGRSLSRWKRRERERESPKIGLIAPIYPNLLEFFPNLS